MTFLYKVKLCNASLAEINCFLETPIKDLFCAAKLTVFTMLLSPRVCWIQKSCKQKPSQRWQRQGWWWWNFGWFEIVNASLPDHLQTMTVEMIQNLKKFKTGIEPAFTFAKTGRNALSIKLLESRPLWRSFQAIARIISTFMSLTEVQNTSHFIYFHSCLRTERCNKKKLIHILIIFVCILFTSNGKREFVPRDQLSSLLVVYCSLFLHLH